MKVDNLVIEAAFLDSSALDITEQVKDLKIIEDIFGNFQASLEMEDGINVIDSIDTSTTIYLKFTYVKKEIKQKFYINGVQSVDITTNTNKRTYKIDLASVKKLQDASSLVAKSFKGLSTHIIKIIHDEAFGRGSLKVMDHSNTSGHYIAPNISPGKAIGSIMSQMYDKEMSPFFLFQRFVDQGKSILTPLSHIARAPIKHIIEPTYQSMDTHEKSEVYSIGRPEKIIIHSDNDNLDYKIANGIYGRHVVNTDLSNSDILVEKFGIHAQSSSSQKTTRLDMFDDATPLLNSGDYVNQSVMKTNTSELFNKRITLYSVPAIPGLGVGHLLRLKFNIGKIKQRPSKKYSNVYVVSKIIHTINDNEYFQEIEVVRR